MNSDVNSKIGAFMDLIYPLQPVTFATMIFKVFLSSILRIGKGLFNNTLTNKIGGKFASKMFKGDSNDYVKQKIARELLGDLFLTSS